MRASAAIVLTVVCLTAAACSSSGSSGPGTSGPAAPGTSAPPTTAPVAAPVTGGGITISGDFTGTATATLCTSNAASIAVTLKGDSTTYRGVISATTFVFVGPGAADYSLKAGEAKPVANAGATSFTVKDATLIDLISKKTVTATGTVTCP